MTRLVEEWMASVDPLALLRRVAEQTCDFIPSADGAAVTLRDGDDCFVVVSAHGTLAPCLGRVTPIDRTFLGRALRSRRPEICHDIPHDPTLSAEIAAVGTGLGVRSCMSIPLVLGTTAIGGMSVAAREPHTFDESDVNGIASMSGFISTLIDANTELTSLVRGLLGATANSPTSPATRFLAALVTPRAAGRERICAEVDALAGAGRLTAVFQPIVDLGDRSVLAYEGLSCFGGPSSRTPQEWFAAAADAGCGTEIELLASTRILDAARAIPDRFGVCVNLSPAAVVHPRAVDILTGSGRDLILELTEHGPAPDSLVAQLDLLRTSGLRLAVDDAGAGFASLTRILQLRPDVLKLDRELTVDIDTDPVRQALATGLVSFAERLGAVTVAEGIERAEQVRVLREIGIRYGQGFWLGRPRPPEELTVPTPR